jgi:hypothetical protein
LPLPSGFSTPSQRYRLPYVACIVQRSSDQPRRWLQYYAPADHSTSLYVRFYGVVRPPSACPTLSTSPGRRAGRRLMNSMPFTGRGLHPAGRFSSLEAPTICPRHLACRGGYRSWPAFGPSCAGACARSPSSTPAALDAPGCSAPYDFAKRKIRRRRPRLTYSGWWHILPRLEPKHFPALHPRRRRLPPPLPGHSTPPPTPFFPSVKLFIQAPAPSGQACAVIMTRNL